MSEIQTAIEAITCKTKKFPQKPMEIILANPDAAIPYLRNAIQKAIEEKEDLDQDYQLHFYALFLLAELEDREFFPEIMQLLSLPEDVLDYLIGDLVTNGLKDIVYHTYNGDIELLKTTITNSACDPYARSEMLEAMGQLYLDGKLQEREWKAFLRQTVYYSHEDKEYSYLYGGLAEVICRCHFVDMLPEIRYMLDSDLLDTQILGEYDSCVDQMFRYSDREMDFCKPSLSIIDSLKGWAMFEDDVKPIDRIKQDEAFEKLVRETAKQFSSASPRRKIGRNDPCPCGSGKKYKFCCLNKPKAPIDQIESPEEREKCLRNYPYTGTQKQEGRIYLTDYFDAESIEMDRILYLGLANRLGFIWERNRETEARRGMKYLCLALEMFQERVAREGIRSFEEYDKKYSIHYFCEDWITQLLDWAEVFEETELYETTKQCMDEMGEAEETF